VALARNISRKHAMEMLLTGDIFSADDALRFGLVNRISPEGARVMAQALAQQIAAKSPHALVIGKETFYRQIDMPLAEAYDHASAVMVENMMIADACEGIAAFLEKRAPVWPKE
jgi:enoyl-CoA hydratase/carnithine racemase